MDDEIYPGSDIKTNDFIFSFLLCCREAKVSNKSMTIILKFIKSVLPKQNKLPSSYNSIIKKINIKTNSEINVCNICHKISESALCDSNLCTNAAKNIKKKFDLRAKVFQLDYMNHLKRILYENHKTIENYKSNKNN